MDRWLNDLIRRHRKSGVLLDTNVLLLYVVGAVDRKQIGTFKRTMQFAPEDYDLVSGIVGRFDRLVSTPNILTEVSNLLGQLPANLHSTFFQAFGVGIRLLEENLVKSSEVSSRPEFTRLGLTDTAIIHVARQHLVVTTDWPLSNSLASAGVDVINFNHIRTLNWRSLK